MVESFQSRRSLKEYWIFQEFEEQNRVNLVNEQFLMVALALLKQNQLVSWCQQGVEKQQNSRLMELKEIFKLRFNQSGNDIIKDYNKADGDKLAFYTQMGDNQSVSFSGDKITWGSLQIQLEGLTLSSASDVLVVYNSVA